MQELIRVHLRHLRETKQMQGGKMQEPIRVRLRHLRETKQMQGARCKNLSASICAICGKQSEIWNLK